MPPIAIGTDDGLFLVEDGAPHRVEHQGRAVTALCSAPDHQPGWLALLDGRTVAGERGPVADLSQVPEATCLAVTADAVLVGTREARLVRVPSDGGVATEMESFAHAPGRDSWYTPWGGPPDVRSLATADDGRIYVNVHVGGILRSDDGGASWSPTIDVDADVHQVLAAPGRMTEVLAATAYGLARSSDGGETWTFSTEGLRASYSRAVAVAGEWLLVSASTGPGGKESAIYRRPLAAGNDVPFERCQTGLPEWFAHNVDTGCLVADPTASTVAAGTRDGSVFLSTDAGMTWKQAVGGLPPVRALAVTGSPPLIVE